MKRIFIMTDGSAVAGKNSAYDAAASYVIIKDNKPIQQETIVLPDHTNNYAEMYAIYKGTKWCLEHMVDLSKYDQLLIITDSELCYKSLTIWMKGWMRKANNETLYGSTGAEVKNQELIKSTYINILSLMLQIKVFVCHINSHKSQSEVPKMYEKMNKQFEDMTFDEFVMIYDGNNHCDVSAREALNNI